MCGFADSLPCHFSTCRRPGAPLVPRTCHVLARTCKKHKINILVYALPLTSGGFTSSSTLAPPYYSHIVVLLPSPPSPLLITHKWWLYFLLHPRPFLLLTHCGITPFPLSLPYCLHIVVLPHSPPPSPSLLLTVGGFTASPPYSLHFVVLPCPPSPLLTTHTLWYYPIPPPPTPSLLLTIGVPPPLTTHSCYSCSRFSEVDTWSVDQSSLPAVVLCAE